MTPAEMGKIEEQIAALDAMTQTPGWKMFLAAMEGSEAGCYEAMLKAPSAEVAKHFGAYNAIRDLKNWPARVRETLILRLRTEGTRSTK